MSKSNPMQGVDWNKVPVRVGQFYLHQNGYYYIIISYSWDAEHDKLLIDYKRAEIWNNGEPDFTTYHRSIENFTGLKDGKPRFTYATPPKPPNMFKTNSPIFKTV